jgi:hypothetical protein
MALADARGSSDVRFAPEAVIAAAFDRVPEFNA